MGNKINPKQIFSAIKNDWSLQKFEEVIRIRKDADNVQYAILKEVRDKVNKIIPTNKAVTYVFPEMNEFDELAEFSDVTLYEDIPVRISIIDDSYVWKVQLRIEYTNDTSSAENLKFRSVLGKNGIRGIGTEEKTNRNSMISTPGLDVTDGEEI